MGEFHDFYWFHIPSFLFLLWKWNDSESVFWLWSMLPEQNESLGLVSTRCTKKCVTIFSLFRYTILYKYFQVSLMLNIRSLV
jgi:hypothetical protein